MIKTGLIIGFGTVWWWPFFIQQLVVGQILKIEMVGWQNVVGFHFLKGLLLTFGKFSFGILDLEINFFLVGTSVFLITILMLVVIKNFSLVKENNFILVKKFVFWLYLPILLTILISFNIPIFQPKRIFFLMPFFILHLFWLLGLDFFKDNFFRYLKFLLIFILLIINFLSLYLYATNLNYQRENWLKVMMDLNNMKKEKMALVSIFKGSFSPLIWYNSQKNFNFTLLSTNSFNMNRADFSQEWVLNLNQYQYLAVFDYLADLTDHDRLTQKILDDNNWQKQEVLSYPLIGKVFIYKNILDFSF